MRAVATLALSLLAGSAHAATLAVGPWLDRLPDTYVVVGIKSEPAYQESIEVVRRGDLFSVVGGAPSWAARSTEAVSVTPGGALRQVTCQSIACDLDTPPTGFLATAVLVAAHRQKRPLGDAEVYPYGEYHVACIPAERFGIRDAVLDPCFDVRTGAVLAQRHRLSHTFDGPSLDPSSIRVLSSGGAQ